MVISIDHHSVSQLINPLKSIAVIGMYMPVYKQVWLVFFDQSTKAGKAPVGKILQIIHPSCRRMGNQNIKALMAFQLPPELFNSPVHFQLRILMLRSGNVLHGAAQSQNPDSLVYINVILNADTAALFIFPVPAIMISQHIQYRRMAHRREEIQIPFSQIPAGQNQIYILYLFRFKILIRCV